MLYHMLYRFTTYAIYHAIYHIFCLPCLMIIIEHKATRMLRRQARRDCQWLSICAKSIFTIKLFLTKRSVAALPGPGAVAGRPAVRISRQLEPSPPSHRLGSSQTLSLLQQRSSSHLLSDRGMAPSHIADYGESTIHSPPPETHNGA